MGQISTPAAGQINVAPIDREAGPGAGGGASGNRALFLGLSAGKNATPSDLIVLGNLAGGGNSTGIVDAQLNGTTIIGSNAAPVLTLSAQPNNPGGLTIIGSGACALMQKGDSSVVIGAGALPVFLASSVNSGLQRSVIIGAGALPALSSTTSIGDAVVIGYKAGIATTFGFNNAVIIGSQTLASCTSTIGDTIVIGKNAHGGCISTTQDVVIGGSAGTGTGATASNTIIGFAATAAQAAATNNTLVGMSATSQNNANTVIGANAQTGVNAANQRSISIGAWAGRTLPNSATVTDIAVIETNDPGGTQKACLFALLAQGNVLLGGSTDVGNRLTFFPQTANATNALGIVNGTRGTGNPTGGGMFYVSGGLLRWVDSAGVETAISLNAAGQLANSTSAYTNNAAAAAGTLTNAPAVGNPTKWIPINDNGTIRNVPAW